jgi:hypothetical protein
MLGDVYIGEVIVRYIAIMWFKVGSRNNDDGNATSDVIKSCCLRETEVSSHH